MLEEPVDFTIVLKSIDQTIGQESGWFRSPETCYFWNPFNRKNIHTKFFNKCTLKL